MFDFQKGKKGRRGIIKTEHGNIETPGFVFCATRGAIKTCPLVPDNTQILLCNAFHFNDYAEYVESCGGIHKFMNWNKPVIMDSGGFQIFSMGYGSVANEIKGVRQGQKTIQKINELGCVFKNPDSGNKMFLNSERSMQVQIALGTDLAIAFDECTASSLTEKETEDSMYRSHRWESRSLNYFQKNKKSHQKLYGIVQGGKYEHLRDISIDYINNNEFDGICIGGSLGKTKEEMYSIVKYTSERLDKSRPIHLLGIGHIQDIIELYSYVDTFDCVEPTRIARHGMALSNFDLINLENCPDNKAFKINLKNAKYAYENEPIDKSCNCFTCLNYNKSYLNYLFKINEINAQSLVTQHNMYFMSRLMELIRNNLI